MPPALPLPAAGATCLCRGCLLQASFTQALDKLVAQLKLDRSILAAILCGSLSHDTVWEKSDIDLALITIDDKKADRSSLSLNADGVNVHAFLMPRLEFRKAVEGSVHHSFTHSMLAKGKLLYTHDETIEALCARLQQIGERDTRLQLLSAATAALGPVDKAHKWFITRGDLDYTALWILYAATPLAKIEVVSARQLVGREVILQALKLNPSFFRAVYSDMLNAKKTDKSITAALDAIDAYLAARAPKLFDPLLDYLREAGEARSATEIEAHFHRNFSIGGMSVACEYLADQKLIAKVSLPAQITRRSNVQVQELAFAYVEEVPDEY
jgi:hypothetical protein